MAADGEFCTGPSPLVLQQCNDLIHIQEILLTRARAEKYESSEKLSSERKEQESLLQKKLQEERYQHAETRATLSEERDRLAMTETEVSVLRKQLKREKDAFEQAFGLLKDKALADSTKAESLLAKCTGLETLCDKKDEELSLQRKEIKSLRKKLAQLELSHKLEIQDLNIRLEQEMYMANHLSSNREHTKTKPKRKHHT